MLPFPHKTQCFNYEHNLDTNSIKPNEDCIVKNMQRLVNKCKCNSSWFYNYLNFNSSNYIFVNLKTVVSNTIRNYSKNYVHEIAIMNTIESEEVAKVMLKVKFLIS